MNVGGGQVGRQLSHLPIKSSRYLPVITIDVITLPLSVMIADQLIEEYFDGVHALMFVFSTTSLEVTPAHGNDWVKCMSGL
jgi:hypothetical protein